MLSRRFGLISDIYIIRLFISLSAKQQEVLGVLPGYHRN